MAMHSLDSSNEMYVTDGHFIKSLCEYFYSVTPHGKEILRVDQSMVELVITEFQFAVSVASTIGFSRGVHPLLRARVEYMIYAFEKIFNFGAEELCAELSEKCICSLTILLKHVNSSIHDDLCRIQAEKASVGISGTDYSDNQSTASFATSVYMLDPNQVHPNCNHHTHDGDTELFDSISASEMQLSGNNYKCEIERQHDPSRTQWVYMCSTTLSMFLVKALLRFSLLVGTLDFVSSLSDCMLMANSVLWQEQFVGLAAMLAIIQREQYLHNIHDADRGSASAGTAAAAEGTGGRTRSGSTAPHAPSKSSNDDSNYSSKPASSIVRQSSSSKSNDRSVAGRKVSSVELLASSSSGKLNRELSSTLPTITASLSTDVNLSPVPGAVSTKQLRSVKTSSTGAKPPLVKSEGIEVGVSNSKNSSQSNINKSSFKTAGSGLKRSPGINLSGKQRGVSRDRSTAQIDEICKSGFIRTLVWMLLHNKQLCRTMAHRVLASILQLTVSAGETKEEEADDAAGTAAGGGRVVICRAELWPCVVEQGLVALLETIQRGSACAVVSIGCTEESSQSSDTVLFPEDAARALALDILTRVSYHLERYENIRTRLVSAMVHSGNTKLRLNIFSGLVFLCWRSKVLGRLLWCSANIPASVTTSATIGIGISLSASAGVVNVSDKDEVSSSLMNITAINNGRVFMDILTGLMKEPAEFRSFLKLILHFLTTAEGIRKLSLRLHPVANMFLQRTTSDLSPMVLHVMNARTGISGMALMDKLFPEPKLLINDNGKITKMTVPTVRAIAAHSVQLSLLIENSLLKQLNECFTRLAVASAGDALPDPFSPQKRPIDLYNELGHLEKQLPPILASLQQDSLYLPVLNGSYYIWQEVFSHMAADSFLLEISVGKMFIPDLFEVFLLSRNHGLRTLHDRYAMELAKRLTPTSFFHVLQASVGYIQLYTPGASQSSLSFSSRLVVYSPVDSSLHLRLCMHCLAYLDEHVERLITPRKVQESQEITRLLHHILSHLFIS